MIQLAIKSLMLQLSRTRVELQNFQKIHNKIIQKQLQMRMLKKFLEKDTYLQKKDKVVDNLRLISQYNNEISKSNKFVRQCSKSTN